MVVITRVDVEPESNAAIFYRNLSIAIINITGIN